MGNSEVGHTNLGAGRIVNQDITRINLAIEDKSFYQNPVLIQAAQHALDNGSTLHLMGLFSDGGVHSHLDHIVELCKFAQSRGLEPERVCVHAFTDGRDTDPHGALRYVNEFESRAGEAARIVSVIGRYHAMDRDRRWERTKKGYDLLVSGVGKKYHSAEEAIEDNYRRGITDEFIEASLVEYQDGVSGRICEGDAVFFFNFRADRGRQLTQLLIRDEPINNLFYATLTPYDRSFHLPVAFEKMNLSQTLGEVLATKGAAQLRVAETEKYPHVTYFFNGGREQPFPGEDRILVASPKVVTYDLQPEMSAPEVAERCAEALGKEKYNFVCLNFANPDMVGHTGVFEAAVSAVEAADAGAQVVVEAALKHGYNVTILADHGNADKMRNPDGSPHTAHTTALVPHLIIKDGFGGPVADGKLCDVAPTILAILGEDQPPEMTGKALI